MWRRWSLALLGTLATLILTINTGFGQDAPSASPSPLGFSPAARAVELEAESHALGIPTPNNARSWLRKLTEEPHVAGTEADYKTAVFVRDKLREWGWKADLAEYEVLLNYPVANDTTLQLNLPTVQRLPLIENAAGLGQRFSQPCRLPGVSRLWSQRPRQRAGCLCKLWAS